MDDLEDVLEPLSGESGEDGGDETATWGDPLVERPAYRGGADADMIRDVLAGPKLGTLGTLAEPVHPQADSRGRWCCVHASHSSPAYACTQ